MEEHKRLDDIKKSEEESKKALNKMSLAERRAYRLKLKEVEEKREKLMAEYFKNNQPNNFSVDSDFTLKKVGFSELLILKDMAAKKIGHGATQLLKNIEAKFNYDRETTKKLKIPPPP
ncbi:hypothetical protein Tco_0083825 [Tanacetum coccineum]